MTKLAALVLSALLAMPAAARHAVPAADPAIARMGRTAEQPDGALRFAYPGVRLTLAFSGQQLSMDAWSSGQHGILEVVVDGGPVRRIKLGAGRATYTLVDTPGEHVVDIMNRTETWHGVTTLAGFTVDGEVRQAPALPQRRMLVLGDSVTCAEGAGERVGKKDSSWTDPRNSYGMLAARSLDAQVHLVCYGGRGLVRSWNGRTDEHNLPDFYELAIADAKEPVKWDHGRYQPDLIVSAIGTNDFSTGVPPRGQYVAAYVGFVKTLLANHPQARIVLTEGAILNGSKKKALTSYIHETVRRVNDPRVSSVPSRHHPGDRQDAHPTGAQHAAMARELAPQLRQIMGW